MQQTYWWGLIVVTGVLVLGSVLVWQSIQTPRASEPDNVVSFLKQH